jgi:hypothetical protein
MLGNKKIPKIPQFICQKLSGKKHRFDLAADVF